MTEENSTLLKILRKLTRIEQKLDRYADKNEAEHTQFKEEIERLKRNMKDNL